MDPEVTFALEKKIETCEKKYYKPFFQIQQQPPPMTHEVKAIRQLILVN